MRVEILQELEPEDDKLEIPWACPNDPRLSYIDLKSFPEKIDQLEECRGRAPLAELLRKINAPGSGFRSAKCDAWTTTEFAEDERLDFKLPFKIGSYVDLVFERPELNSQLEHHLQLAEKIRQILGRWRVQAQAEIAVRHCLFRPEKRWGYYLTVFAHAYGSTIKEAEEEWSRALCALGDTFVEIGPKLGRLLVDSAETPSSQ